MFDSIRRLLSDRGTPASRPGATPGAPAVDHLQLAACVLLLEVAHIDGEYSEVERRRLHQSLQRHFGLDEEGIAALLAAAETERSQSVDHFRYTQQLVAGYDLGQKMVLAELMWGIILADGTVDDHEAWLVRKLGHLLNLEPGYLSQARRQITEDGTTEDGGVDR